MPALNRIEKLKNIILKSNVDCLIVSDINNIRYLSGFTGSEGWMVISSDKSYLAVDFRYKEQVKVEASNCEIVDLKGDMDNWLIPVINDIKPVNIGFESDNLSFSIYNRLKKSLIKNDKNVNILPTSRLIEDIRMVKEPEEIDDIIKAVALTDGVLKYAESIMTAGLTEKQLSWELEKFLRENGSESIPFEIIVASGLSSALPHARPSDNKIALNSPLLIDIGARINGYCSDMSRTFCPGKADETFKKVYDIVLAAQMTALNIIESGMNGQEADSIARAVIIECGYAEYFGHGLGHGLGLLVHEVPRLGQNSRDMLKDNMVFTVEPGIYIPGWGGIRIEDTVIMENGKINSLSTAIK
jgi:Xaa-Pro aminopeptidase